MFSMSRSTKKFPTVKNVRQLWRVIPLEMHFFVDSLLLVTQIIKGKQLYYKMWSRKSQILRIIDIYVFFKAILITYIKGEPLPTFFCRRGLQWRWLHLLIFFTKFIKFYWLMLLLYPGELYRLLGASSFLPWLLFPKW